MLDPVTLPVHLTTSDPAAHLSETLAGSLEHLTVSRIDPHAQGRALLEEDLRSPCTE